MKTTIAYRGQGDDGVRDQDIFAAAVSERSNKKKRKNADQQKPAGKKKRQPRRADPAPKKEA